MSSKFKTKKTVIVLGAARSGTSAVAGLLDILGVDMGKVRPPDETNPQGYYEDIEASLLIKEIFDSVGSAWENPPTYKKFLDQKDRFGEKVKQFCLRKSKKNEIWGWKVPGTNLAIELFLPYLVNPHFVVVFRNPLRVAGSMVKRRKLRDKKEMSLLEALNLTGFYNEEIIKFFDRHLDLPKIFVTFEDVYEDPVGEAKKIADFIELEWTKEKKERINKFIVPRQTVEIKKNLVSIKKSVSSRTPGLVKNAVKRTPLIFSAAVSYIYYLLYYNVYFGIKKRLNR
jgi:hypothetical protein